MSVFMGWFGKPEKRIVISAKGLEHVLTDILLSLIKKDTVIMVFGVEAGLVRTIPRDFQQYIFIWESDLRLDEGLRFSNLFIASEPKHPFSALSDQYYCFDNMKGFTDEVLSTIPKRFEHDFNNS
ncbi:hypothetical protein [Acinetobacter calcoaceticus]